MLRPVVRHGSSLRLFAASAHGTPVCVFLSFTLPGRALTGVQIVAVNASFIFAVRGGASSSGTSSARRPCPSLADTSRCSSWRADMPVCGMLHCSRAPCLTRSVRSPGFALTLVWVSNAVPRPPAKRAAAMGIVNGFGNLGNLCVLARVFFAMSSTYDHVHAAGLDRTSGRRRGGQITIPRCSSASQGSRLQRPLLSVRTRVSILLFRLVFQTLSCDAWQSFVASLSVRTSSWTVRSSITSRVHDASASRRRQGWRALRLRRHCSGDVGSGISCSRLVEGLYEYERRMWLIMCSIPIFTILLTLVTVVHVQ